MRVFKFIYVACKMSLAQLYVKFLGEKLVQRNVWIVSEKKTEARDNGYHFFKYLCQSHPEIDSVYVIQKGCSDFNKIRGLRSIIAFNSFKHCVYYYAAKCRVCSQIHGVKPYEEVPGMKHIKFFRRADQRHINLKHGISKDARPDAFDFRKVGFDLYIAAAKPEYDYIKKEFDYPDKNIALTGFCRFDALYNLKKPEKVILIMPTFREWLRTSDSSKEKASDDEMIMFKQSGYYIAYYELLKDNCLLALAKKYGYKIKFYMHYTFQPYCSAFEDLTSETIIICNRNLYDVQELMQTSAILVTDFSSIFFDYAYMNKPTIYYQFDLKTYRKKHYQEGYFSYERDGFGPVVTEKNEVVDYLELLLNRDAEMETKYKERVEKFFVPHDNHNCDRVYEAILKLEE